MKILIAADMEGISGVTNWNQVDPSHSEYPRFRKIMVGDVNAAIAGAFVGGADEVMVTDGHGYGNNLLVEELDHRVHLNSGNGSPFSMVQGIDSGVDGVLFVGYHACAGSWRAILDHTWSSIRVANVWINDALVGEIGLNSAVCAHFGAPVLMISGDQTACGEARQLLGTVEVAVVKHATGRMSAECIPPEVTRNLICEAAARGVSRLKAGDKPQMFSPQTPIHLKVELFTAEMADQASLLPGAEREGGRIIAYTAADMPAAYRAFRAIVTLART